eukprot:TRINITY_DN9541_c0_g1_i2.p1 TRINITY_DN9541_c0_g1~~TRINITY_DN9541_c0_g1_i2.p1  ORF type:complete len:304 (-),score=87.99 TRINITY_DN9541_c0_g1_i2:89-1000(-)
MALYNTQAFVAAAQSPLLQPYSSDFTAPSLQAFHHRSTRQQAPSAENRLLWTDAAGFAIAAAAIGTVVSSRRRFQRRKFKSVTCQRVAAQESVEESAKETVEVESDGCIRSFLLGDLVEETKEEQKDEEKEEKDEEPEEQQEQAVKAVKAVKAVEEEQAVKAVKAVEEVPLKKEVPQKSQEPSANSTKGRSFLRNIWSGLGDIMKKGKRATEERETEEREKAQAKAALLGPETPRWKTLLDLFSSVDKNGDGLLSKEELRQFLEENGQDLNSTVIDKMIADTDIDGDGKINITEFIKKMQDWS